MINKLIKNLTFRKVLVVLVGILILLYVINTLIPVSVRDTLNNIITGGQTDESSIYPAQPELEAGEGTLSQADQHAIDVQANADRSLLDVMPYNLSDNFSVTYIDGKDEFDVQINPLTDTTEQDVYDWMSTFKDGKDPSKLNVVFFEGNTNGAPAGP